MKEEIMKRKAVLIGCSPPQNPCAKVNSDVSLIKDILLSLWGGAWQDDEIQIVDTPTASEITKHIEWAKGADYSIVYFAGHGQIRKGRFPWKETHVQTHDMKFLPESDLNPGTPWCSQIFDCCRGIDESILIEKFASTKLSTLKGKFETTVAKTHYNLKLSACEKGVCRLYSASSGQSATTKPNTFTELLHRGIIDWLNSDCKYDITLNNLFEYIDFSTLKTDEGQQKPEYNGGRRLNHFPLVIRI